MRDEHYSPFVGADRPPRVAVTVFVMTRLRGDQTASMQGSLRTGSHGVEAVYLLNGELYSSQWFATEVEACDDLAAHQDVTRRRRLDGPCRFNHDRSGQNPRRNNLRPDRR